ncbi:RING/FYVE/PHD zinc finger superfamily protein, partial [Zea mays]
MHPSSSGRFSPVDSLVMTKKLLRTQSSVSALSRLSPNRQVHEFGKAVDNLSHQPCEKASLLKNNEEPRAGQLNPCIAGENNHGTLAGYSNRHADKNDFSLNDLDNGTLCSKDEIQEHGDITSNDNDKKNVCVKQDSDQDCSMDISNDRKLNTQHDVMTDCGNSEGLIDVNVCDICGDVGREYLLATCTRCLEGAEHTYCMRVKMEKVPVGEWFCEECQLKEDQNNTRSNYGNTAVNVTEGKNQRTESQSKLKALQIVVPDLDAPQVTHSALTADQCDGSKSLHLTSADTQTRLKDTTTAAERLDMKNKKTLSVARCNKLQVLTSDLDTRPHSYGKPTSGVYNKKSRSSDFLLNHKKLQVSTDMESPLSSEGLQSPPISSKRHVESMSSPKPRLFKTGSLGKHDVISRDNSFKKSNKGGLTSVDNVPVRTTQAAKSSETLSRSYSMGNMVNAKAPIPSARGLLSKQLSFNSTNNGPKVKQLADKMSSKLRPAEHSPRDPRDKEPIKKIVQSGSFKREGSDSVDVGSSKQKQTFHLSRDEKPGVLKP